MDAFLQWLAINGYHQDLLAPADFPDTGRGMKALRDIKVINGSNVKCLKSRDLTRNYMVCLVQAGDVIVEIPDALLFTATTKAVKDVTSELCPDATHLSEHATLALFLAFHRHGPHHPPHPNFSPYMDVLPTEFSTVGCVGASQRVQSAMPARMRRLCDAVKGRLDEDYASVGGGQTVERKDFEWGWMCVNTRCISLTRKTNSTTSASCPTIALAPMLDLLNHHPATTTTALYTPHKHFRLTTHEDVRVGDQVFISYGAHDNEFLAAEYGFVVAENMWDMAEVEGMDVGVGMGSGDGGVVEGVLRACGLDG
ncbi:hypothetical protein DFJ77DRAFT_127061 [Powellomyces hirtus]|nr:hypothetical protein DFJ77DRAFT_127061 [Powellomyces hirtus]